MDDLDYETVEAWDDEGNRHVTRILAHEPPATDTTMIPTAELDHLRQEIALLRAGESERPAAEGVQLTPAEWVHRWNRATPDDRLECAAHIMNAAVVARRCEMAEHEAELDHLRREVARVREVLAKPGHRCLNPWPCTIIRTADGDTVSEGE